MGNLTFTRKKELYVTPSGVPVLLQATIGEHQSWITNSEETRRKTAIDDMLKDCIVELGDKKDITAMDIDNIFSFDRAAMLFKLRQISNRLSPNFIFDYEFPVSNKGEKRQQRYEVLFNKKDFKQRPASWVYDKMVTDYKTANEIAVDEKLTEDQIGEVLLQDFPVVYENYAEMLAAHKDQETILPDTGVKVLWKILDIKQERAFSEMKKNKETSSHDQLLLRCPVYRDDSVEAGAKILPQLPLNKLSSDDIETLRNDIITREASIDTSVTVQYRKEATLQKSLNLITVPSFFFPSLAK